MRVAVVSPYDLGRPGGVQDQAVRLTAWIRKAGHDAFLVGPGVEGPPGAVLLGPAFVLPFNRSAVPIELDREVRRKLAAVTREVDVVHVHEPFVPAVSLAALSLRGPAKVATFHADLPRWVQRLYGVARPLPRAVLRRAAVLTAVSPVAARAARRLGVDARLVPNGIDVAGYRSDAPRGDRVAFVGRDDPRKGLEVLLRAWETVRARVPGALLDVVGIRRRSAPDGVRFHGQVDEDEKRRILGSTAVLAAPNLGAESFGIVLLEGMAAGCAVVASALPAFTWVLGDAGELVAPGDARGLGDRIAELLIDRDRLERCRARCSERSRRFDGPVVAGGYLRAYGDALADP